MAKNASFNRPPDKLEKFKNIFDENFYTDGYNYDDNRLNRIDLILKKGNKSYVMTVETYESHMNRLAEQAEEEIFEDPAYVLPRNEILPSYLLDIKYGDWSDYEQYLIEQDNEDYEETLDDDLIDAMRATNIVREFGRNNLLELEFQALRQVAINKAAESGIDLHEDMGLYIDLLNSLHEQSHDFFVHPVTFEPLGTTRASHDAWRLAKEQEGRHVYDGLTARINPFFVEYMVDVCDYDNDAIAEKLTDIIIKNPRSVSFADLINPNSNKEAAVELITKWWHNLTHDGLDSSQIMRTLSGEINKSLSNTISIGTVLQQLFEIDSSIQVTVDHLDSSTKNYESTVSVDVLEEKFDLFLEKMEIDPSTSVVKQKHMEWLRARGNTLTAYEAQLWKISPFLFQYVHDTFHVDFPAATGINEASTTSFPIIVLGLAAQSPHRQPFFDLIEGALRVGGKDEVEVIEGNSLKAKNVTKTWARALEADGCDKGEIIDFIENSTGVISSVIEGQDPFEKKEVNVVKKESLLKWLMDRYKDADEMKVRALTSQLDGSATPEDSLRAHEQLSRAIGAKNVIAEALADLALGNFPNLKTTD